MNDAAKIEILTMERDAARALVIELSERVFKQAGLLSKKAENGPEFTNKNLIDAVNHLCKFAKDHLPANDDYTIELKMREDECSLTLFDGDGEDVDYYGDERSHMLCAVNMAREAAGLPEIKLER